MGKVIVLSVLIVSILLTSPTINSAFAAVPDGINDLTLTGISDTQVDISWTTPADGGSPIMSFQIFRSLNFTPFALIQTSTDPTLSAFSDTTLSLGDSVTYMVRAVNIEGNAAPSNIPAPVITEFSPNAVEPTDKGGDNAWPTRPTFAISHEDLQTQIVETGFKFNTNEYTLTNNYHTDFPEEEVEIGTANSFSATVYANKGLKVQEFLFGIPNVGEGHLAELGVEVWYDRDGQIEDVKVIQKSEVIELDTVSVVHQKVKCSQHDSEAKCDNTTVSMKFLEPLKDKVMAIGAIDFDRRSQRTSLNEGFNISGESLNSMNTKFIPSQIKNEGLVQVTQISKYSPHWTTDDGKLFEMNKFGSFKQINKSFERFQDTGSAFTRQHSEFDGILQYEQNRAIDLFDSTKLIADLPNSFVYHYENEDRLNKDMKQEMILQQEIANRILDEMNKQARHH